MWDWLRIGAFTLKYERAVAGAFVDFHFVFKNFPAAYIVPPLSFGKQFRPAFIFQRVAGQQVLGMVACGGGRGGQRRIIDWRRVVGGIVVSPAVDFVDILQSGRGIARSDSFGIKQIYVGKADNRNIDTARRIERAFRTVEVGKLLR